MKTFTGLKPFEENPGFPGQKKQAMQGFDINSVDPPIRTLIRDCNSLPYCFTLQSCCGHFVRDREMDPRNTRPLSRSEAVTNVEYRIAYIAFCIRDNGEGTGFLDNLISLCSIDPEYIQVGCAGWFWNRPVNSYVVQIEPYRYKSEDTIIIDFDEAVHVEMVKNEFFNRFQKVL